VGNWIGVSVSGSALANSYSGVLVYSSAANTVIGGGPGSRNAISGNVFSGVRISDAGTNNTTVRGNIIGLNPVTGAAVPNQSTGVTIWNGAQGTQIGGLSLTDPNIIQGNTSYGVYISDATTKYNTVVGNSIYNNSSLGIGLNATANESQAAPALTSAVAGNGLSVPGNLTSTASSTYRLDFYTSPTADSSGAGEGRTYLGNISVTTNAGGTASFTFTSTATLPAGAIVTATATNANGSTSAFAVNRTVTMTDSDGDGIPDAYETAHGLNPSLNDAALDPDGDGLTNLQEYLAGSDPHDATSKMSLTLTSQAGGDMAIDVATLAGKTYRIEKRLSLGSGTVWLPLVENILGTGSVLRITDPGAITQSSSGFYRVLVVP
jgi:hypothetical protein